MHVSIRKKNWSLIIFVGSFRGDPSTLTVKHIPSTEGWAVCQEDTYTEVQCGPQATKELGRSSKNLLIILHAGTLTKLKPNKTDTIEQPPKRRSMLQEYGDTEPGLKKASADMSLSLLFVTQEVIQ